MEQVASMTALTKERRRSCEQLVVNALVDVRAPYTYFPLRAYLLNLLRYADTFTYARLRFLARFR